MYGLQQGMEPIVPSYPSPALVRSQRRRKRIKKRNKNRMHASGSSSEDAQKITKKKNSCRASHVNSAVEENETQLWNSFKSWSAEQSSCSSYENYEDGRKNTLASSDIFRHHTWRRQEPNVECSDHGTEPIDVLTKQGAKWFEWEYWKDRLTTRFCLPKPKDRSSQRQAPRIDFRPSYLGRYDDNLHSFYSSWRGPQQHYYVMHWPPQLSPAPNPGASIGFSPTSSTYTARQHSLSSQSSIMSHTVEDTQVYEVTNSFARNPSIETSRVGKSKKHRRKSSSLRGTRYESHEPLDPEEQVDVLSVSSLESLHSTSWKTPVRQLSKHAVPDTNTTVGTHMSHSPLSNRIQGLRQNYPRAASPRPGRKPPVPPPLGSKHKCQRTNSTMESTVPAPFSSSPASIPILRRPNDLARSFSEASSNTNGSRHRRGGTVCEFSFDSLPMTPSPKELSSRPPRSGLRSPSLPLQVQIPLHVLPKAPVEHPPFSRRADSMGSWDVTPAKSYLDDNIPDGYVSPLEEENFVIYTSPVGRTNTNTSPREVASNTREACAADIDSPLPSNPQDSLFEDEENDRHAINTYEETSPFANLKKCQPSIQAGDSWMWSWVNQDESPLPPAAPTETNVVTITQSLSPVDKNGAQRDERGRSTCQLEYLPKNLASEAAWRINYAATPSERITLSGWLAFGLGDALVKKLTVDGGNMERSDVMHLIMPDGSEKLWLSKMDGTFDSMDLSGCRVEVHEISRQHGQAIYLKRNSTGETVCTLLPICLPKHYSGDESAFGDGSVCFPRGAYLPDDQQYTCMHLLFALDIVLKSNQSAFLYF